MWSHLPSEELIRLANAGNYGLAPKKWTEQLEEIRALDETPEPTEEAPGGC